MVTLSRRRTSRSSRTRHRARRTRHRTRGSGWNFFAPSPTTESRDVSNSSSGSGSVSGKSSQSHVNGKRNTHQSRPSAQQRRLALQALREVGFTDFTTDPMRGTYGYVYFASFNPAAHGQATGATHEPSRVAVKVLLEHKNKFLRENGAAVRKLLNAELRRLEHTRSAVSARRTRNTTRAASRLRSADRRQFFVDDYIFTLPSTPGILYQMMERVPGMELGKYMKLLYRARARKRKTTDPEVSATFPAFHRLACSLVEAVHFFHQSKVVFDDMKLENVLVDPDHPNVVFIDYNDSNIHCTRFKCGKRSDDNRVIRTYQDLYNRTHSTAEGVWRLGLLLLDMLSNLFYDNFEDYPAQDVKHAMDRHERDRTPLEYPTSLIRHIVHKATRLLFAAYPTHSSEKHKWAATLLQMLDKRPERRPTTTELLTRAWSPFAACRTCTALQMRQIADTRNRAKRALHNARTQLEKRFQRHGGNFF